MLDKEEVDKLPLKERLAKLEEMEKEREKDIEEAKRLKEEIEEAIEREEALENVEVPEPEPVDLSGADPVSLSQLLALVVKLEPLGELSFFSAR